MAQSRNTVFVSVNLTEPARDALQGAVVEYTSPAGRRLTLSEVLIAALGVAHEHPDETVAALGPGTAKAG